MNVYDSASKFYNETLGIYFEEYEQFSDSKINKMDSKYDPTNLMLNPYDYKDYKR